MLVHAIGHGLGMREAVSFDDHRFGLLFLGVGEGDAGLRVGLLQRIDGNQTCYVHRIHAFVSGDSNGSFADKPAGPVHIEIAAQDTQAKETEVDADESLAVMHVLRIGGHFIRAGDGSGSNKQEVGGKRTIQVVQREIIPAAFIRSGRIGVIRLDFLVLVNELTRSLHSHGLLS